MPGPTKRSPSSKPVAPIAVEVPRVGRPGKNDHDAVLDAHNADENTQRFGDDGAIREPRGDKKRRALALEILGESLVHLKPGQLSRVPMPDDLAQAVNEARRILANKNREQGGEGFRRQVQRIGAIMRTLDAEPISISIGHLRLEGTLASEAVQKGERWRTRLLEEGDAAIDALCAEQAAVDRTALRQLVRAAQKEKTQQLTSPQTPSTNQRKVFRMLRTLFDPMALAPAVDDVGADDTDDIE